MQSLTCLSCHHFRRHYVLSGNSAMATNCGHCIFSRGKHRRPGAPACAQYQPAGDSSFPDREKVIHYLSTEILDYIRSFPLPPKMEE